MTEASKMKVYRLNEYDWVAATSLGEALYEYQKSTGIDDDELIDESWLPRALSEEELEKTMFFDEEGEFGERGGRLTFQAVLEAEMKRRPGESHPFLFASTEV
jgi:hypothetical protein